MSAEFRIHSCLQILAANVLVTSNICPLMKTVLSDNPRGSKDEMIDEVSSVANTAAQANRKLCGAYRLNLNGLK